ncbi:MAG: SynChlorMet cassette protein ScmC [Desulfomonile tiedjei]|uniref:SynChlorMet cassette protein ScmC n=1 Tax=Desulfomonile tiedjei TaxID=2358 RepID=A0A9D6Z6G6_9BACT|nr:SynChlorMet cassette protein ScmC [Desulfomonile tiedjei]
MRSIRVLALLPLSRKIRIIRLFGNSQGIVQLSYYLTLAGTFTIRFSGTPETDEWLGKFAKIMRLESSAKEHLSDVRFFPTSIWTCWHKTLSICQGPQSVSLLPADSWQTKQFSFIRVWHHQGIDDICCEMETGDCGSDLSIIMMAEALHAVYLLLRDKGGFPVHAALVEREGMGVLLVGASGVGKSTCSQRLPNSWNVLGDDLVLAVPGSTNAYLGHPLPTWSQLLSQSSTRTWNVQSCVPIVAVMVLEQAEEDEIIPLGQSRAAMRIAHSASYVSLLGLVEPPETVASIRRSVFNNAARMAKSVPAFVLRCSLHGKFWRKMEEALKLPPTI